MHNRGLSQSIRVDGAYSTIYLAGFTSTRDLYTNRSLLDDFEGQVRNVYARINQTLVEEYCANLHDLVATTAFITNASFGKRFAELRKEIFDGHDFPTSALIVITSLASEEMLVEVQSVAVTLIKKSTTKESLWSFRYSHMLRFFHEPFFERTICTLLTKDLYVLVPAQYRIFFVRVVDNYLIRVENVTDRLFYKNKKFTHTDWSCCHIDLIFLSLIDHARFRMWTKFQPYGSRIDRERLQSISGTQRCLRQTSVIVLAFELHDIDQLPDRRYS